jgi:hypothetical protein
MVTRDAVLAAEARSGVDITYVPMFQRAVAKPKAA